MASNYFFASDVTGWIIARYNGKVPEGIDAIAVSETQWQETIGKEQEYRILNGKLVKVGLPPTPYHELDESGTWQLSQAQADALLADYQAEALVKITAYAKQKRLEVAGTTDEIEIATWTVKENIAKRFFTKEATEDELAIIDTEIEYRALSGETRESFCQKILDNAKFFALSTAAIDGLKYKAQEAVNIAPDSASVDAAFVEMQEQFDAALVKLLNTQKQ